MEIPDDKEEVMQKRLLFALLLMGFVVIGLLKVRVQSVRGDGGQIGFTFETLPKQQVAMGVGDTLILDGQGTFNASEAEAEGGGSFTRFITSTLSTPCGGTNPLVPPCAVVDSGVWKATRFMSFTSPGTYGAHEAGILVVEAEFISANGTVAGATVMVFCNIGAGKLFNLDDQGKVIPGGVGVSLANGDTFRALAPADGLTIFSRREGD